MLKCYTYTIQIQSRSKLLNWKGLTRRVVGISGAWPFDTRSIEAKLIRAVALNADTCDLDPNQKLGLHSVKKGEFSSGQGGSHAARVPHQGRVFEADLAGIGQVHHQLSLGLLPLVALNVARKHTCWNVVLS